MTSERPDVRHTKLPLLPEAEDDEASIVRSDITHDMLTFIIDEEAYAFPLEHVREILKVKAITPVPRAPFGVLGILSVRGKVTTVVDMRRLLRMPEPELTRHGRILLVHHGEEVIGVLVDRVVQVYRLLPDEIEHSPMVSGDLSDYVTGIGRPRGERDDTIDLIVLLDPTNLLRRGSHA